MSRYVNPNRASCTDVCVRVRARGWMLQLELLQSLTREHRGVCVLVCVCVCVCVCVISLKQVAAGAWLLFLTHVSVLVCCVWMSHNADRETLTNGDSDENDDDNA